MLFVQKNGYLQHQNTFSYIKHLVGNCPFLLMSPYFVIQTNQNSPNAKIRFGLRGIWNKDFCQRPCLIIWHLWDGLTPVAKRYLMQKNLLVYLLLSVCNQ